MSAVPPEAEKPETTPVPRLLVELPSWPRVFFGNLRDLIFPPRHRPLELRSAPAAFWHDVFVKREFPWYAFFESGACHFLVLILLVGTTRFLALPPRIAPGPVFDRSHVVYYARTEYLPAIDTRTSPANRPRKADPELARQPIISVPREADNRSQTIVTPAQRQTKNRRFTAQHRRLVGCAPETPAGDSRCSRHARRRDYPHQSANDQRRRSSASRGHATQPPHGPYLASTSRRAAV